MRTIERAMAMIAALAVAACATTGGEREASERDSLPADSAARIARPAPGPVAPPTGSRSSGYLGWEDLGVRLLGRGKDAGLRIDITTLDEDAVALAGDDVRSYFADLHSRIGDALPPGGLAESTPFLVAFTGNEKQVHFDPTRLLIQSEGSTYYVDTIVPLGADFDRHLVDLFQTVYAVYLFDPRIDLLSTLEFQYGEATTADAWRRVVERVQRAKTQGSSERRGTR